MTVPPDAFPLAVYLHIPFCRQRCTYCDFNTYAGQMQRCAPYVRAMQREIRQRAAHHPRWQRAHVTTIYVGGGTPSLLPPAAIEALLTTLRQTFAVSPTPEVTPEVTMEANPGTVTRRQLAALRRAGVNRLSMGVQTTHPALLRLLGRIHTTAEAHEAVSAARAAGFQNLSLDLMYGLPTQTLALWEATLARVLAWQPDHLSLYALTLAPGTPLAQQVAAGNLAMPTEDEIATMYEHASARLQAAGWWQYELSNWARGDTMAPSIWALPPAGRTEAIGTTVCRHNLAYWRMTPWLGIGAGAYSWLDNRRWRNRNTPAAYIAALAPDIGAWDALEREREPINTPTAQSELLMMGLRLAEGVTSARFAARFGVPLAARYGAPLTRLAQAGWLEWNGERVRLTERARLVSNPVLANFL